MAIDADRSGSAPLEDATSPSMSGRSALDRAWRKVADQLDQTARAREVIESIASMINPHRPLEDQHDLKMFWHPRNFGVALQGQPFGARPITMEIDCTL